MERGWRRSSKRCSLLAAALCCHCQVSPLTGGAQFAVSTVWGGGVSGTTPGKTDGALGVGSLGGTGPNTPWLSGSWYDGANSTHVDRRQRLQLCAGRSAPPTASASSPSSNRAAAAAPISSRPSWPSRAAAARARPTCSTAAARSCPSFSLDAASPALVIFATSLGTTSFTAYTTYSLLLHPTNGWLYFNDNNRVFRTSTANGSTLAVAGNIGSAHSGDGSPLLRQLLRAAGHRQQPRRPALPGPRQRHCARHRLERGHGVYTRVHQRHHRVGRSDSAVPGRGSHCSSLTRRPPA